MNERRFPEICKIQLPMKKIFVQVKGFSFTFNLDSNYRHNLMSPPFLSFFKEDYSETNSLRDNQRAVEQLYSQSKDAFPTLPDNLHHFSFVDVYKPVGQKLIRCSDNKLRICKAIKFSFQINERQYSNVFYLDNSLWHTKHVHALLGSTFKQ